MDDTSPSPSNPNLFNPSSNENPEAPKGFDPYSLPKEQSLPVFNDSTRFRAEEERRVIADSEDKVEDHPEFIEGATATTGPVEGDLPDATQSVPLEGDIITTSKEGREIVNRPSNTDQLPSTIAGPIKQLQYSAIKTRANLIEQLVKTIPLNEYGFPVFIYRPDFLDPARFQQIPTADEAKELQDTLSSAIVHINYGQGFPVLRNGMPIWSHLTWEALDDYNLFTEYLEQVGVRSLHSMQGLDAGEVLETFTLNYWAFRVKAYDRYHLSHASRQRAHRIISTEDNHFALAEQLLKKVRKRFDSLDNEEIQDLPLMDAVKIASELTRIQRLSVGLPGNGVLDESKVNRRRRESIEVEMRREAQLDGAANQQVFQEDEIDLLRDNPDLVEAAQDLILQISTTKRPPQE